MDGLSLSAQMGIFTGMVLIFPVSFIVWVLFLVRSDRRRELTRAPRRKRRRRRSVTAKRSSRWPCHAANDD